MKQIKVEAYICIDEHGNYQIVGSSKPNQENKMIALVREGIEKDGVSSKISNFKVMIDLPETENGF